MSEIYEGHVTVNSASANHNGTVIIESDPLIFKDGNNATQVPLLLNIETHEELTPGDEIYLTCVIASDSDITPESSNTFRITN